MKLGNNYCIIHQSIILDEQEVNDHFEKFLTWIMSQINLKTISKDSVKCIGRHFIDAKYAKKFEYHRDEHPQTEEYKITFAFHESEQEAFVEKVHDFWVKKSTMIKTV